MNFEEELSRLTKEWERTGGNVQIAEALGDHHTRAQNHRAARRWYREAIRLSPENTKLLDKLEDSTIRGLYGLSFKAQQRRMVRLNPLREALLHYTARSYERRIRTQPSDSRLHFELGKVYYIGGRIDSAMAEFEQGLKHEGSRAQGYFYLARCFMKKRRFEEALLHLARIEESGLLSGGLRAEVRHQKVTCLVELGRSGEAADFLSD